MVPRGADAVVMVEHTDTRDQGSTTVIDVRRAVVSGQFMAFAGSDLARGETVLRAGQGLTSRGIGMLAAVGSAAVAVWRRPRVAIISTGDEIVAPGKPIRPGAVYDSNAAIIAAAVEEAGGVSSTTSPTHASCFSTTAATGRPSKRPAEWTAQVLAFLKGY